VSPTPTGGHEPHAAGLSPARRIGYAGGGKEIDMPDSVYKIIELVGTSTDSLEAAAKAAVVKAAKTLRDLRIAEVSQLDLSLEDGKIVAYRAKVKLSFKYED